LLLVDVVGVGGGGDCVGVVGGGVWLMYRFCYACVL